MTDGAHEHAYAALDHAHLLPEHTHPTPGILYPTGNHDDAIVQAYLDSGAYYVTLGAGDWDWRNQVNVANNDVVITGQGRATRIVPSADFPADGFVFSFYHDAIRPVAHAQLRNLLIYGQGTAHANQIHGVDLCAYRSLMEDVSIYNLSGDGLRTRSAAGTDGSGWSNYETKLHRLDIGACGRYGINANSCDQHWSDCVIHTNVTSNVFGVLTGCMIANSHFFGGAQNPWGTQTLRNIHLNTTARTRWMGGKIEHAAEELIWLDGNPKAGSISFIGVGMRGGGSKTPNTYAQVRVTKTAGAFWKLFLIGCPFDADMSQPSWNVQIAPDACRNSKFVGCDFKDALTGDVTPNGTGWSVQ